MRALVIDPDANLRTEIIIALSEAGFATDQTPSGREGLWFATNSQYDIVVVDYDLADSQGAVILRHLRQAGSDSGILMLSARSSLQDRIRELDAGADDFMVKPIACEELVARARALVRRRYDQRDPVLRVGNLQINTITRRVSRAGEDIELTGREYSLLTFLAMRQGQVVSRSEIWESLYHFESSALSNVVDVYINYLRKKIERPHWATLIHTRRGHGYIMEDCSQA
ncbi:MAG: response regulator transcription factor [Planctomycetaceae bacterium]